MIETTGPKIELLIGMIASGKSTYARKRADEGALVISHDDLTEMLHGRYRYEPDLKGLYRFMQCELAHICLTAGRDVVIDRTHLDRDSRAFWVREATGRGIPILAVVFPRVNARTHALRRFEHDARGRSFSEWFNATRHHAGQAEAEPFEWEAEGFSGVIHVKGDR